MLKILSLLIFISQYFVFSSAPKIHKYVLSFLFMIQRWIYISFSCKNFDSSRGLAPYLRRTLTTSAGKKSIRLSFSIVLAPSHFYSFIKIPFLTLVAQGCSILIGAGLLEHARSFTFFLLFFFCKTSLAKKRLVRNKKFKGHCLSQNNSIEIKI